MRVQSLIGGELVEAESDFESLNPSTGDVLAKVSNGGSVEVDMAVAAARDAAWSWSDRSPLERAEPLRSLAALIGDNIESLALLESQDTGKPISQARTDVSVAARYFQFYANVLDAFFGERIPTGPGLVAFTERVPYGVTGHIVPWNYPLQIAARTIAPALAAGNCSIVKPAEEAPLTIGRLGSLALEAGIPTGVLNIVQGEGPRAGAALASHPDIDHISFTGSPEVGRVVAQSAGQNLIPVMLELGGKSPNIVFPDADVGRATEAIVRSVIQNAGQTCSAGSRLLVHESIHDDLVSLLADRFGKLTIGAGPDDPDVGPLISRGQLDRVTAMVSGSGTPVIGGSRVKVDGYPNGFFFSPTIFDDVDPDSNLAREEVFGPVLAVLRFESIEHAIALANATPYGLIAAIWTQDIDTALLIARHLQVGQVYVNSYGAGGGVELPFGGFRKSGYGREKGFEALMSFTQVRTTAITYKVGADGP